jgi:potassium-transporting ATPase KdpC subunit
MNLSATLRQYGAAIRMLLVLTVVVGLAYPLAMTGVGQVVFHHKANGSLVASNGQDVGSALLGQNFTDAKGNPLPQWFQPRPSAAGADGYDGLASGGSNLGPSNATLVKAIEQRKLSIAAFDSIPGSVVQPSQVPADAVTASASGLDPDISPANAYLQVNRVASARGLSASQVKALVTAHITGRSLGILGEDHVNVLELNLALAALAPQS